MSDQRWLQLTSTSREVSCSVWHDKPSLRTRDVSIQSLPLLQFSSLQRARCELLNHDEQNHASQGIPNRKKEVTFDQRCVAWRMTINLFALERPKRDNVNCGAKLMDVCGGN